MPVEERLNLDDVVFRNFLSQMHFFQRIKLELVNHRLADAFGAIYANSKISLFMYNEKIWVTQGSLKLAPAWTLSGRVIEIPRASVLCTIFARCKNYRTLWIFTEKRELINFFAEFMSNERYVPKKLTCLRYWVRNSKQVNIRIIEQLSPLISKLDVRGGAPISQDAYDLFWKTVSQCNRLKSFVISCVHINDYGPVQFQSISMSNCLARLSIQHLELVTDLHMNAAFLSDSLYPNQNLRKLSLLKKDLNVLADPLLSLLLNRLTCLTIQFNTHDMRMVERALDFIPVLSALSVTCKRMIVQYSKVKLLPAETERQISNAAQFWLNVSDAIKQCVWLTLVFTDSPQKIENSFAAFRENASAGQDQQILFEIENPKNIFLLRQGCSTVKLRVHACPETFKFR